MHQGESVKGLSNCPDCGTAVSDHAPSCPKCGRPAFVGSAATQRRHKHPVLIFLAVGLLAVAGLSSWKAYRQSQLPPLPMLVKSRPAVLGAGQVIVFENPTDQPLAVAATLSHPATNAWRSYQIYTPPHASRAIGALEGWTAQSGDCVFRRS